MITDCETLSSSVATLIVSAFLDLHEKINVRITLRHTAITTSVVVSRTTASPAASTRPEEVLSGQRLEISLTREDIDDLLRFSCVGESVKLAGSGPGGSGISKEIHEHFGEWQERHRSQDRGRAQTSAYREAAYRLPR
jgi:hypothetical protein